MNRNQIIIFVILPLVMVGAVGYHRIQRGKELEKQKILKAEGSVTVSLETVKMRSFQGSLPFTGTLLAVNRAELKAEVPGRVTRICVQEGDAVAAGSVLSAQDEEDLLLAVQAAEAQLAQAQAQAAQARRDNERMQMLLEKRSVTKQAAQQAETYFNASQAGVRAAESNLGLAKSRLHKAQIKAPFAGQVSQKLTQVGEMLSPGQPAFVVVDNRTLEILADLPAESATQVQVGMKASFKVKGAADELISGTVSQVSPSLTQDGRTLRVRIVVPNPGGKLKSGFFAEGEILAQATREQPSLPSELLTLQNGKALVFVETNGFAKRQEITVGPEQKGFRVVELPECTRIVNLGRDLVVDGSKLKITDNGKEK